MCDNRKILVRFTNEQKNDLVSASKTANPEDLFVSENLTPLRKKKTYALRQANKKFPQHYLRHLHTKWSSLCMDQAHWPVHWRFKYSSQNCDSGDAEKILQRFVRYTIRPGSEWFFWLFPTPMNLVQCLWYYCLTSMCMFTTSPPWYWSVYPLHYILYVLMFIMNSLRYQCVGSLLLTTYVPMSFVQCHLQSKNAYVYTSVCVYSLLIIAAITYYTYLNSIFY